MEKKKGLSLQTILTIAGLALVYLLAFLLDRIPGVPIMLTTVLRTGFRMVVFSVIIMIVVLFFRKGIMGTRELSLAGLADRLRKESAKGGNQA